MNLLIVYLFLLIPFSTPQLVDIKGNTVDLKSDDYILVILNGWNCKDCIKEISSFLKNQNIDSSLVYYVIESDNSIYSRLNLKKLVEDGTDYYNTIIFNPKKVIINDKENSLFLAYSKNNRTPALIIKSDSTYFYSYDNLFRIKDKVTIDEIGLSTLKRDFILE